MRKISVVTFALVAVLFIASCGLETVTVVLIPDREYETDGANKMRFAVIGADQEDCLCLLSMAFILQCGDPRAELFEVTFFKKADGYADGFFKFHYPSQNWPEVVLKAVTLHFGRNSC